MRSKRYLRRRRIRFTVGLADMEYKASVVPQDSEDRTVVVVLDVEYKASVASKDSVDHFLVAFNKII